MTPDEFFGQTDFGDWRTVHYRMDPLIHGANRDDTDREISGTVQESVYAEAIEIRTRISIMVIFINNIISVT